MSESRFLRLFISMKYCAASSFFFNKPVNVLIKGGKKQTNVAKAIFDSHPNPNQAIIKGRTAMPGVTLNTTAYGAIYLLNVSLKAAKTARVFPIIIP